MKNKFYILVAIVICGILGYGCYYYMYNYKPPVQAKAIHVAIINAAKIKADSKRFKQFEADVIKQSDELREMVLQKESVFRAEYEGLRTSIKNAKKNDKNIDELKKAFQKKIADFERDLQSKKETLMESIGQGRQALEKNLTEIIEKIAKDHHFNLVLNSFVDEKKLVMYADNAFDISDLVIADLDQSIKK
jgi:Skp family chaperone for outer membrane proteins